MKLTLNTIVGICQNQMKLNGRKRNETKRGVNATGVVSSPVTKYPECR